METHDGLTWLCAISTTDDCLGFELLQLHVIPVPQDDTARARMLPLLAGSVFVSIASLEISWRRHGDMHQERTVRPLHD